MKRLVTLILVLAVIGAAGYGIFRLTDDSNTEQEEQVIVIDEVGRATLQDTVVVRGTVGREDLFTVTALGQQRVTGVTAEVDAEVAAGDELLRLDGRPMLAIEGATPYWRPLQRFVDDGPDVEMLEQFLADAGFGPGTINQEFTNLTRDALEEWQEANGYPVDGRLLPSDLAVNEWPAVVGSVDVEVGDSVNSGQALVSFVERDSTISVAVDPTDRSRLEVGLPALITVTASDIELTGRVAELAEAPETDGQGVERYAGKIERDGALDIVDGAAVRVEVTLAEVVDAMVVPVASVSLDGSGGEEIRILAADGTIERVSVVTGLTEGALVEIVEGLDGSEQVVVEVRQ
ncbi:MAG: efflux RND transporter periplasmic adaptor subunit [Acidimicrobiales bacterium]